MIDITGVTLRLNQFVQPTMLEAFDEVILASGIVPRTPEIEGITHPKVLSYLDVLRDKVPVGEKVAIIGCGGIGFDTAMYLSQPGEPTSQNIAEFCGMGHRYQPQPCGRFAPGRPTVAEKSA
jgi:2,4-dienoyl-CoA reductase (NADPH2)